MMLPAGPGQEVLMEFRMSREESEKLKDIEERLHMLQSDSDLSSEVCRSMG